MRFSILRLVRHVTIPALLLFTGVLQASAPLTEQIRIELEDELYPFESIVPGYKRPAASAPKIAVAEFRASSDELVSWSQAISEILRYRIQYVPGVRLYMPAPYYTHTDAQAETGTQRPLLTSRSAFQNLNKALGIESVLTGSVEFNGTEFALTAELVDTAKERETLQRVWHFPFENLPTILISISEWAYLSLGVELTPEQRAYLQDEKSLDHQAIEDFVSHYSELQALKGPLKRDLINQLQKQHPDFIILAIYALHNRAHANNLDEAYKNLELYEKLRSSHPGNAGVELESYRAMEIGALPKHEVAARINNIKNLVKANPHDPTIMINFADALVHNGNSLEGIATLLEATARWPDQYRAWWSLGWALNRHAWQVRGNSMWRDVPERAKGKFKTLSHLSDLAIDEALTLNPRNARLWNQKINTIGSINGFSEELMATFNKAIELAPNDKGIYDSAMNYSADKWGGNAKARRHILASASKNNPDAAWPVAMRNHISLDSDDSKGPLADTKAWQSLKKLINHPDAWKLLIVFIGILLWLVYFLGKKSAQNEAEFRDNRSDYDSRNDY